MHQTYHTRRFVEFSDTDMAGIAHFSSFFRYMESAEHALMRSLGLSVFQKLDGEHTISFPRVSTQCEYKSPAFCEDELDIAVTIERMGKKSVSYAFHFSRDGQTIAEGKMTAVCCRLAPGKPPVATPLPEDVTDVLRPFVVTA